jgi:hypothetical protein
VPAELRNSETYFTRASETLESYFLRPCQLRTRHGAGSHDTAALPPLPFHALSRPANRGQAHFSCVGRCGARGRLSFVPSHQLTLGDEFTASRRVCCFAAPLSPISQTAMALHARRPRQRTLLPIARSLNRVAASRVHLRAEARYRTPLPVSLQGTGRLPP